MEGMVRWVAWSTECAACGLFAIGVVTDLRSRTIPNAIPLLLVGLFAVYAIAAPIRPTAPLWSHLAIGAILLAAGFVLFSTGRFGAGDAKLIAAAGTWVGPADLSLFLFGLGGCALALSAVALLPLAGARRTRSELPFAVAVVPPALAVMIPRVLAHDTHLFLR